MNNRVHCDEGEEAVRSRLASPRCDCLGITSMKFPPIFCLLLAGLWLRANVVIPVHAQPPAPKPKTSIEWFAQASEQMNIRMPGSPPFRMKVTFHAFPGREFLGLGEKSKMITGDGVYEETWLEPHRWRREVTLAGYRAVEVESDKGRKMQASSDYEPSRVLMLLDALLNPIPRNLSSREFPPGASRWHVVHLSDQNVNLLRISRSRGDERGQTNDAFYFTPSGLLVLRNEIGLLTSWENDIPFGGKAVPKHVTVKVGDRFLLTADIDIAAAGAVDPTAFDLPVQPADRGTTLRPLHAFEARSEVDFSPIWRSYLNSGSPHAFSFWSVLDRHGKFQEVEVILQPKEGDIEPLYLLLKANRSRPPEIDGSPCELEFGWGFI